LSGFEAPEEVREVDIIVHFSAILSLPERHLRKKGTDYFLKIEFYSLAHRERKRA